MEVNKIYCGDGVEVMKSFPSNSVELIVTSPPYNLKNSTGNGMKDGRGGKWSNAALLNGYEGFSDNLPHPVYVQKQRHFLEEALRIIPETGAIFYNHKWRVQNGLLQDRSDIVAGFPVRQIIIWRRKGGINFNKSYFLPTYEVIYLICKKSFVLARGANALGDVWEITQDRGNPHPASFPLELPRRCIDSVNADLVLDPFCGSGTTLLAAKLAGINYIGIETSPEYIRMAEERLI